MLPFLRTEWASEHAKATDCLSARRRAANIVFLVFVSGEPLFMFCSGLDQMGVLLEQSKLVAIGQLHLALASRAFEAANRLKPSATFDEGLAAVGAVESKLDIN
jgi:hypothetical protein